MCRILKFSRNRIVPKSIHNTGGDPPDEPPGAGIPEVIWRWIVYLKRRICLFEREAQINNIEKGKSAAVAA